MTAVTGTRVPAGSGESVPFLGSVMTLKSGAEAAGFSFVEQEAPSGFASPLHVHTEEDEAFYVLEGSLRVACGDERWTLGPRDYVLLPKEVPHAIAVAGEDPVTLLQITSPAGFERMAREVAGAPFDPAVLAEITARHGATILGPPPW